MSCGFALLDLGNHPHRKAFLLIIPGKDADFSPVEVRGALQARYGEARSMRVASGRGHALVLDERAVSADESVVPRALCRAGAVLAEFGASYCVWRQCGPPPGASPTVEL